MYSMRLLLVSPANFSLSCVWSKDSNSLGDLIWDARQTKVHRIQALPLKLFLVHIARKREKRCMNRADSTTFDEHQQEKICG